MQIIADLHTHTCVSDHAFSTLREMAEGAKQAGLCAIAITDHGPMMEDGAHPWHFSNLSIVPRSIHGVTISAEQSSTSCRHWAASTPFRFPS